MGQNAAADVEVRSDVIGVKPLNVLTITSNHPFVECQRMLSVDALSVE